MDSVVKDRKHDELNEIFMVNPHITLHMEDGFAIQLCNYFVDGLIAGITMQPKVFALYRKLLSDLRNAGHMDYYNDVMDRLTESGIIKDLRQTVRR